MEEDMARIEARADSLAEAHAEHLRELVALRDQHDLTQAMVAERMGVSQPTVAAFEHYDSNPTLSTIRRYALAVGAKINLEVLDDCADHNEDIFDDITSRVKFEAPYTPARSATSAYGHESAKKGRVRFNFSGRRGKIDA